MASTSRGSCSTRTGRWSTSTQTWFAIGDAHGAAAPPAGDRARADQAAWRRRAMISSATAFGADSVFAAGTNADIVALWYPEARRRRTAPGDGQAPFDATSRPTEGAVSRLWRCRARGEAITSLHAGRGAALASPPTISTGGAEQTLAGARHRPDVRCGLRLRRRGQPEAGARRHPRLLRPDRPEAGRDSPWSETTVMTLRWRGPAVPVSRSAWSSGTGTRETLQPLADVILDSIVDLPAYLGTG